jgi:type II secretion system (T2SS) protein E
LEQSNGSGGQNRWERPDAPLGTLIYRAGLLSKEKLEFALQESVRSGRRLGEVLLQKGWIDEKDLARLLAGQKGLAFVSLRGRGVDQDVARLLSEQASRFHHAVPFEVDGDDVLVAVADPTDDRAMDAIGAELGREFKLAVATATEIRHALDEVYAKAAPAPAPVSVGAVADAPLRVAEPPAPSPPPAVEPPPPPPPAAAPEATSEDLASPVEPTIERDPDAHVSVAFNAPAPATAPESPPTATPEQPPAPAPEQPPAAAPEPPPAAAPEPPPAAAPEPPPPLTVPQIPAPSPVEPAPPPEPPPPAAAAAPIAVHEPPPAAAAPPPAARLSEEAGGSRFRLLLELEGSEDVEVGLFDRIEDAEAAARDMMARVESGNEWPRIGQRFVRPERIISVQIAEKPR